MSDIQIDPIIQAFDQAQAEHLEHVVDHHQQHAHEHEAIDPETGLVIDPSLVPIDDVEMGHDMGVEMAGDLFDEQKQEHEQEQEQEQGHGHEHDQEQDQEQHQEQEMGQEVEQEMIPPVKAKKTRSREGCLICRTRRIKCDNAKPECARCIKYGAECVYPPKKRFDGEAVKQSLARRHRKPSSTTDLQSTNSQSQSQQFDQNLAHAGPSSDTILTNVDSSSFHAPATNLYDPLSLHDAQLLAQGMDGSMDGLMKGENGLKDDMGHQPLGIFDVNELMAFFRQTQMGAYFRQKVEPPEFLKPAFPDPDELRCFHHAVTYSFSICVTREDFNPWVQHIAPLFLFPDGLAPLSAEAVRWAMLRVGAVHLSYLDHRDPNTATDGSYERALAHRYRTQCMGLLRRARSVEAESVSDTLAAALLMFFFGEVLSAETRWHEPYRMMRETITRRGGFAKMLFGDGQEVPSSLKKYLVEQLTWVEIIASDLQSQLPVLLMGDLGWFDRLGQTIQNDNEAESIEAAFGVNRAIFRLSITNGNIIALTEAADRNPTAPAPDMAMIAQWVADMHDWRDNQLPILVQNGLDNRTRLGSLAYWHACMMGYYRIVEKRERGDAEVQQCAIAVLDETFEAGEKVEFILWLTAKPLIVAGCNLLSPVLRARCRELVKTFQYQCCYELEVGMKVLEETWNRIDAGADKEACDWREIMLELGCASFFG